MRMIELVRRDPVQMPATKTGDAFAIAVDAAGHAYPSGAIVSTVTGTLAAGNIEADRIRP